MEQNDAVNGQGEEPEEEQVVEAQSESEPQAELHSMESLLEEEGLGLELPKSGEIRTGIIASVGENEILVSVGSKSEGVISGRELEHISDDEKEALEVGAEITVYVVTPEDANGNVVLSYSRARELQDWEQAETLLANSDPLDSEIIGYNKGGLLVPLGRLRGFVPASQISLVRRSASTGDTPDQRWGKMVGEEITVRVIEVDRERRRLILSERAALQETRESLKDRLLEEIHEGDVRQGRVTSVADFGAFVNIDGADGLVHLSEISWERIQHPSEVLEVGDDVEVKVISIDHDRKRIGLSLRQLQDDPWLKNVEHLREGQLIEGTVTHITKFGAFARLDENLEGLIHVSELSEQRINHPKEVVNEGDVVTLRVIKIEPERRRIGLSLRKVDSPAYQDLDWKIALAEEVEDVQDVHEVVVEDVVAAEVAEDELEMIAEEQVDLEEELLEVVPDAPAEEEPEAEELATSELEIEQAEDVLETEADDVQDVHEVDVEDVVAAEVAEDELEIIAEEQADLEEEILEVVSEAPAEEEPVAEELATSELEIEQAEDVLETEAEVEVVEE
jgi:small subunit ribosomal protein S1